MYLDDKLLRQQHQERVQSAELERLAMAAHRDARAARRTARPAWRDLIAVLLRRARPAIRLRGA